MSSRKCPTCGETYRKGKKRIVHHFDGSISVAFVCPECVRRTLSIVTQFPRAAMTVDGVDLLQRVLDRLRTYLHGATLVHNEQTTPLTIEFQRGRIYALNSSIELIQRAIAGIAP